ncbi:MAG: methyltransferase [Rhodobacter sp.]|nr:methyltransferase [Rhodobacter sp.]
MALPDTLIARLIETVHTHKLSGNFLMLGRQRWMGSRKGVAAQLLQETLEKYLPGIDEEELKNEEDGYSERFFQSLGFDKVDAMDLSDFEGASITQDLGAELRSDLVENFDVIYDGGTCEHVFDISTAYRNIHKMLKPGGVLIGHSPCNNWINHSFYQISPEIVYGFWEKAMGYEILQLYLQPLLPSMARRVATTTNPNVTGRRPRIIGDPPKNSPIVLNFAVRKPETSVNEKGRVFQTDYMVKWKAGETGSDPDAPASVVNA